MAPKSLETAVNKWETLSVLIFQEETEMEHEVVVFKAYPFKKGQKIRIEELKGRSGDWEVTDVTDKKMTLRCPISKKEVTWDRFCFSATETRQEWPKE